MTQGSDGASPEDPALTVTDPVIAAALSAQGASVPGELEGLYYTAEGVPALTPDFLEGRGFTHQVTSADRSDAGWSVLTVDFDVLAAFSRTWPIEDHTGEITFEKVASGHRMVLPADIAVADGHLLVLVVDRGHIVLRAITEAPPLSDPLVTRLTADDALGRPVTELVLELCLTGALPFFEPVAPLSHHLAAARRAVRDGVIVTELDEQVAAIAQVEVLDSLFSMTLAITKGEQPSPEVASQLLADADLAGDFLDQTLGGSAELTEAVGVLVDTAARGGLSGEVIDLCRARLAEASGDLTRAARLLARHIDHSTTKATLLRDAAWYASLRGDARRAIALLQRCGDEESVDAEFLLPFASEGPLAGARNEPCRCGSDRKYKRCHAVTNGYALADRVPWVQRKLLDYAQRPPQRLGLLTTAATLLGVDAPSDEPMAVVRVAARPDVAWLSLIGNEQPTRLGVAAAGLIPADEQDLLRHADEWRVESRQASDGAWTLHWVVTVDDVSIDVSPPVPLPGLIEAADVEETIGALKGGVSRQLGKVLGIDLESAS